MKTEVGTLVGDNRGLVGRIRDFQAVHGALDGITVYQPADLVAKVSQTVQQAVVMQQAFEPVQAGTFSATGGKLALDALTGSSVQAVDRRRRGQGAGGAIQSTVNDVSTKVDAAHTSLPPWMAA